MQPHDRHEEIILASARLFRDQGYTACSIRQIGDALGMTSAALYYHFKNKDELLLGIMRLGLNQLHQAIADAVASARTPQDQLRAAVRAHLRVSLEHRDFAAVITREMRHLQPGSLKEVIRLRDTYEAQWETILNSAQRAGVVRRDVDLRLFRLLLFGALNNVLTWFKFEGEYDVEEVGDAFLAYLMGGVMERKAVDTKRKRARSA